MGGDKYGRRWEGASKQCQEAILVGVDECRRIWEGASEHVRTRDSNKYYYYYIIQDVNKYYYYYFKNS